MSYGEIAEVNGVQTRTVEYIIRNFASEIPETPVMRKKKKDVSAEDYDVLHAEITRQKKKLRYEKMRSEALNTMIDVAEEVCNISVRKKLAPTVKRLHAHRSEAFTVTELCGLFGKIKQAYYKHDCDVDLHCVALFEVVS